MDGQEKRPASKAGRFFVLGVHSPRCTRALPCYCAPASLPYFGANSMNIHEYQAKDVLRGFGTPVPSGKPAFSVEEAVQAAQSLPGPVWVVKAQIHAGGRGKGGGVKVVKSIDDVRKEAERMLGMTLVTHQTGPHGRVVKRLYIEDGSAIERELYLSALVDRETPPASPLLSPPRAAGTSRRCPMTRRKRFTPSRSSRSRAIRPSSATRS